MTEAKIQSKILTYLRKTYPEAVVVKLRTEASFAGLPDILMIKDSVLYGFEVKRPGGRLTKLQEHTLKRLEKAGAITAVVRSVKDVRGVL